MVATRGTKLTRVDSTGESSTEASPMPDATSNENFSESSPPTHRVASAGEGIVGGIAAIIIEGITTASWEVDGTPTTTGKLSSE